MSEVEGYPLNTGKSCALPAPVG